MIQPPETTGAASFSPQARPLPPLPHRHGSDFTPNSTPLVTSSNQPFLREPSIELGTGLGLTENQGASRYNPELFGQVGAEMTRDSTVWETYVQEVDRWDKEMIEGRNSSLDVLLLFAALFSAISTAFINESLKNLKPDYAETSALALLDMSRTLVAISNGQRVLLPEESTSSSANFSPSHSAILVNVLWIISLALSLAVSLLAMLAKGWCYNFMSARSGQAYERARRRQQRWNGIQKWRMQELIAYLPGLMHLALLLFATGLCIFLQEINKTVGKAAIVVTVVTGSAYALATIISALDPFCPFHTPITPWLILPLATARQVLTRYHQVAFKWVRARHSDGIIRSYMVPSLSWCLQLLPSKQNLSGDSNESSDGTRLPPMDTITSQMLAWIIKNCEDTRLVDASLQALAGATSELPHSELADCRALELLEVRLRSCLYWDPMLGETKLKDEAMLPTVMRYTRAYSMLISGNAYTCELDRWQEWYEFKGARNLPTDRVVRMVEMQCGIFLSNETSFHNQLGYAVYAAALMRFCLWDRVDSRTYSTTTLSATSRTISLVTSLLGDCTSSNHCSVPSEALVLLLDSCAPYLVGIWPKEPRGNRNALPKIFVDMFMTYRDSCPKIASVAAITLAAAAFSIRVYPGSDHSWTDSGHLEKRGVRVLQHYRKHRPDKVAVAKLFTFGYHGLFPYADIEQQLYDAHIPEILAQIEENEFHQSLDDIPYDLFTLPPDFTIGRHIPHLSGLRHSPNLDPVVVDRRIAMLESSSSSTPID